MRIAFFFLCATAMAAMWLQAANKDAILNSKHDFRAGSAAEVRSVAELDSCVFCHTPHRASPAVPLWNQQLSSSDFAAYESSTLDAASQPVTPQDPSKLCLSCHDGTIALGDTLNDGLIPFLQGTGYMLPDTSPSNLAASSGFTDDHPVAVVPITGAEIQNPPVDDPVRLDSSGRLQCTSCHDPHQEYIDQTVGKFLVKPNEASALCLTCHQKAGWLNSSHRLPADPLTDQRYTDQQGAHTGYVGVSQNGCESCHRPHAPQVGERLVKFSEENACYACHDGSVVDASLDIRGEFEGKTYTHPVALTPSVHDAAESPSSALFPLPEASGGAPRHTECVDCHNPHFVNALVTQPPAVGGALLGTTGHSTAGTFLPQSANEFETCFKCHADSANRPQFLDDTTVGIGYGRNPQRQFDAGNPNRFNTRLEFEFGTSYHPVTRPRNLSAGIGGEVPSLRTAPITPGGSPLPNRTLNAASYTYCSDCHNNDTGRNLGSVTGPSGVHGSSFEHLLERQNLLEVPPAVPGDRGAGASYALSNYALCDKCHDIENSILRDDSFDDHRKHIRGGSSAACSTCHDPHSSTAPMLINFDLSIVGPSSGGRLEFQRTAPRQGACYLTCHGKDHDPADYGT